MSFSEPSTSAHPVSPDDHMFRSALENDTSASSLDLPSMIATSDRIHCRLGLPRIRTISASHPSGRRRGTSTMHVSSISTVAEYRDPGEDGGRLGTDTDCPILTRSFRLAEENTRVKLEFLHASYGASTAAGHPSHMYQRATDLGALVGPLIATRF
ncbi:hypothetical protein WOLCODRAFT_155871 [Wolfiporia cocos MD-104 SS10]|uniref:Uncharacterized protein n=1 Tax=Wolfiporia cocos (strain MD-104) TaxID=742152 RepID=A0A2H3JC02_WOLCO|nr:hypothetical protein WOLCODRAFT_155871 [Wolfiporia cocos MD-104 SS10]